MNAFDHAYRGTPPWDIDRPQREIVRLFEDGAIRGEVLDVGCGTGENTLYLAEMGHRVMGLDASPLAIEKAKAKAEQRRIEATFAVWNVLELPRLGRVFDTVVDSGLFHIFSNQERTEFAKGLNSTLRAGGTYYMLCFSDREPTDWGGPRRVTQEEIGSTFRDGWRINYIRTAIFETRIHPDGGRAWLSSIKRV